MRFSPTELAALQTASRALLSPLTYGSLDHWRSAVNSDLMAVVEGDSAMFTLLPATEVVGLYSGQVPRDQLVEYEGLTVRDGGAERAFGLEVFNQTMIVAGDWSGYNADPVVDGFYKPNRLLDAIGFFLPNLNGAVAAVEIHKYRYGTELFGEATPAALSMMVKHLCSTPRFA